MKSNEPISIQGNITMDLSLAITTLNLYKHRFRQPDLYDYEWIMENDDGYYTSLVRTSQNAYNSHRVIHMLNEREAIAMAKSYLEENNDK